MWTISAVGVRTAALEVRARAALADDTGVASLAEDQRERVDQDRLAGAGLAGEDGEAGVELELERVDDDEVADGKRVQHGESFEG